MSSFATKMISSGGVSVLFDLKGLASARPLVPVCALELINLAVGSDEQYALDQYRSSRQ
jgi:hypothetical protein